MGKVRTPEVPKDLVPMIDQLHAVLRSEETQQRLATIRVIRERVEGQRQRAA